MNCRKCKIRIRYSFFDVIDEEKIIVVLSMLLWWRQWRLWIEWSESEKHEGLHQVCTVGTILTNAQDNTIAVQLLFGELEKREEWLLAGLVCQCFRQDNIKDVVVVVKNLREMKLNNLMLLNLFRQISSKENLPSPNLMKFCQWHEAWWWCEWATFVRQFEKSNRLHHRSPHHRLHPWSSSPNVCRPRSPPHQWKKVVARRSQPMKSPTPSRKMFCEHN